MMITIENNQDAVASQKLNERVCGPAFTVTELPELNFSPEVQKSLKHLHSVYF